MHAFFMITSKFALNSACCNSVIMEKLKIRKLHTQPSEKLCLANGEKKIDLGELKKQLRS